jgi:NADPH-dependent 2,4-dienoyl-CoA reductase/sulfur reductase-like enzyme
MTACDLAVVGAGPAGLAAATLAAGLGLDTLLLDEQSSPGGQIYRDIEAINRLRPQDLGILGDEYKRGLELAAGFRASGARYAPDSTVWHVGADGRLGVLDRAGARLIAARRIILATGAMERPVAIPGWTLPGVIGVGAAQTMLKASGQVPDVPTVIAGSGPLTWLVACQLARAGAPVHALLVTTPTDRVRAGLGELPRALRAGREMLKGLGWIREVSARGIRIVTGVTSLTIEGAERATAIAFTAGRETGRIPAGLVLLHEGVIPRIHMTLAVRCRHVWDDAQLCWHPETDDWGATTADHIAVAGDGAAILGAAAAEPLGRLAALDAACRLGRINTARRDREAQSERAELARHAQVRPLLDRLFRPVSERLVPTDDATILCRCEDVTVGEVRAAVAEGATDPNRVKLLTRCGMGPCQGRMCGPTVAAVIARERGVPVEAVGTWRVRTPVRPLPLVALAALEGGLDAEAEE